MMSLISARSKKTLTAGDRVRDAFLAQCLFDHARLVVAAIQDCVIGKLGAALEAMCRQRNGDLLRFLVVVLHRQHLDRVAQAVFGP